MLYLLHFMPFNSFWHFAVFIAKKKIENYTNDLVGEEKKPHSGSCTKNTEQYA